jgi:hypothetical protein
MLALRRRLRVSRNQRRARLSAGASCDAGAIAIQDGPDLFWEQEKSHHRQKCAASPEA